MPSQSTSKLGKKNRDKPRQRIPPKNRNGIKKTIFGTQKEWERTFDAMPDLIAILDGNYRILRANRAMAQHLGLTPDQCAGKICYKLIHGVDKPPDFCPHTLTLADGREHIEEIHEDSLGGDVLVSITPLTDEHGRNFRTVHVARNITQRKQIEKALIDAQKDLKHAQAVAHTGNWRLDINRNELLWSDETYRIFAISRGTPLTYETFLDSVHPDDRSYVDQKWKAALQGEPYDIEHRIIVGDEVKWVRERAEMEFGPEGKLLGGFGIVHDLTDRKRLEEQLREAHERATWLARLPEEDPNPVMRVSADGFVLYCNAAAAKLQSWKCVVGQATPGWLKPLVDQAIAKDAQGQHDLEIDGRCYFVWIIPISEESYINVYGRDITERRRAEEALRKSEERFRRYFELGLIGMAITSPVKNFVEVNDEICRILGYERDELLQKTWADLTYPKDLAAHVAQFNRVMAREIEGYTIEKQFIRKDGRLIDTIISVRALHRTDGSVDYFVVLLQDITERKRMADELSKSRDELEIRVQARTEELKNVNEELRTENEERLRVEVELRDSEARLRELSTALLNVQERERKLLAQEIHDSMGAILAASKIKVQGVVNEMDDGNPHIKGVLESVIPLLQGTIEEARRIQMSLRPSMLDDLGILATINWFCRHFESTYSNIQIKKEINIQEHEVPESLKIVIFRVLQEALNNAAKHSKASDVLLQLSRNDQAIQLVIRDTGKGFVLEEAYSRKGMVRGLGLDSMRKRTKLSGGVFSIESRQGVGTVIRSTWLLNS